MAQVRMLVDISGGRADGTAWPQYGTVLVCGDREAEDHIATGRAERVPGVPEDTPQDGSPPAAEAPAEVPAGDEPPGPEDGSEGVDADGKPLVRDPKQAWADHAVAQGCDAAVAASMTKADLIAQYGNP